MTQLCHKRILAITYLFGKLVGVFNQELNNCSRSGTSYNYLGSSYFFYQQPGYPRDCYEASSQYSTESMSGLYVIKPDGYPESFEVYCDSEGWTVIHRIQDGSLHFNRNWSEYKNGFGFISQEFWLGNDKVSSLSNQNSYELRIDLTSTDGMTFYVKYSRFRISDEYSAYKLTSVGEYNGADGKINMFLCPTNSEGAAFVLPDCSQRCFCSNEQFVCDDAYQCSPNAKCEKRNTEMQCYCNPGYTGNGVNCSPVTDCQDVYDRVATENGVYKVKPVTWQEEPFDVFCNMTDGGGWTVFQRRFDGSQNFFLYWSDYKDGFGNTNGEYWLGNDKLHSLTTQRSYEFRVDLVDSLGDPYYAKHTFFNISDESDSYRLNIGNYSEGDTGDHLNHNNGQAFTTRDRDNDNFSGNCATRYHSDCTPFCTNNGAWWYNSEERCSFAHLNSPYGSYCLQWFDLPGRSCNIKYTEMKVRPI